MQPSTSINLNINLIKFPQFQLANPKGQNKLPSYNKNPQSTSLSLKPHTHHNQFTYQNMQDSPLSSSFEQFHPTMSTQSLCKAKKIYQRTIKAKTYSNHSVEQFYDVKVDVNQNSRDNGLNGSRNGSNQSAFGSQRSQQQQSKKQQKHLVSSTIQNNKKNNQISSTQSKKIPLSNNSSSSSSSSYNHPSNPMPSKQPFLRIDCEDNNYQQHQSNNDFVQYGLFSQHFKKGTLQNDKFKKKKSSKNNYMYLEQISQGKVVQAQLQENIKYKANEIKQNKGNSNNLAAKQLSKHNKKSHSHSKSKSKSKSKPNTHQKHPTEQLKQLNFQKSQIKSSTKHKVKKNTTTKQTSNKRSKSRSQSKSQKHFIRSKDQFAIINHNLSPSTSTRGKHNISRPSISKSKSKSKSRSRSNSHIKTFSNSKSKKSHSKSVKRSKLSHQKSLSPSFTTGKNKFPVKEFNEKSIYQVHQQNNKHSNSKDKKKSLSKQKVKKLNQQIKSKKSISQKQTGTFSKQITNQTQRNVDVNKFSKNKSKKIAYAKTGNRYSPEHSKSTNFYVPQRKQKAQNIKKQSSVNSKSIQQQQEVKRKSQKLTISDSSQRQKIPHESAGKKASVLQESVIKRAQRVLNAVILIQRVYRGYRVRRQLNEDLMQICQRVQVVREKISDKKSKYWIGSSERKQQHVQQQERNTKLLESWKKHSVKQNNMMKGFESMLSSSNSIQSINYSRSQQSIVISADEHHSIGNSITSQRYINRQKEQAQKQYQQEQQQQQQQKQSIHTSNNNNLQQQQQQQSFFINYPQENSKSSLIPQDQIKYLQQLVSRDVELNKKLLKENQKLKEHIRSISSQHVRSTDRCRDQVHNINDNNNSKCKNIIIKSQFGNNPQTINVNTINQKNQGKNNQEQIQQCNIISRGRTQANEDNLQGKSEQSKLNRQSLSIKLNDRNDNREEERSEIKGNSGNNNNNSNNNSSKMFEQFFQPYSPKHYIVSPANNIHDIITHKSTTLVSPKHTMLVSPKHNPSPSLSKIVSPISNASSLFNHHQIPFSLQSPQNIIESQKNYNFKQSHHPQVNLLTEDGEHNIPLQQNQKRYFQARNKSLQQDYQKQPQVENQTKLSNQIQKKIQLLNKLFYEDKLLSPKTYQNKLSKLQPTSIIQAKQIHKQNQQKPTIKLSSAQVKQINHNNIQQQSPYQSLENYHHGRLQIHELVTSEQKQSKTLPNVAIVKKVKLTQLTEHYGNGNSSQSSQLSQKGEKLTITKALFKFDLNQQTQYRNQQQQNKHQKDTQQQQQQQQQQVEVDSDKVNFHLSTNSNNHNHDAQQHQPHQPQHQLQQQPTTTKIGFPTELLFIKNYIFEFFQYIKTHPNEQKTLLHNMLILPFDNQHLLTCYRTQLQEIDPYYYNKVDGHFLAYPYWRNLIDYQPVVNTDIFQQFSHMLQTKRQSLTLLQTQQQGWQWLSLTQQQQKRFTNKYRQQQMGLKDLQRIFLMMLMDAFNQAFQQQRCSYQHINLLRQQKGGMNKHSIVSKAISKIKQIQQLQKSIPSYYLLQSSLNSQQSHQLQNSTNHQFFLLYQLKKQKQQLVDVIFCSVLKRVLESWGRQMCGLIIEPQEEDEMQITVEQIQAKNTQRLCLALNKYVEQYEKEIANVMREHEVCTKLILTDRLLEELLFEVVKEIVVLKGRLLDCKVAA